MRITDHEINKVISAVKKEPLTVFDISKIIGRSWITTDKYLKYIKEKTGAIDIKTFRKGSQAALKIVYYVSKDATYSNEIMQHLADQILGSRFEVDFDFMEIFQFIDDNKKKSEYEHYKKQYMLEDKRFIDLVSNATKNLFIFSGNLSLLGVFYEGLDVAKTLEILAKRRVFVKILTRINVSSISNINKIKHIIAKYPDYIELRHRYQPLRGFMVDTKIARFKNDENVSDYKKGELSKNTRVFFEVYDKTWINWLEKLFWNMFNSSISYKARLREINRIFE